MGSTHPGSYFRFLYHPSASDQNPFLAPGADTILQYIHYRAIRPFFFFCWIPDLEGFSPSLAGDLFPIHANYHLSLPVISVFCRDLKRSDFPRMGKRPGGRWMGRPERFPFAILPYFCCPGPSRNRTIFEKKSGWISLRLYSGSAILVRGAAGCPSQNPPLATERRKARVAGKRHRSGTANASSAWGPGL